MNDHTPYRSNVPGPCYVVDGCCTTCGAPEMAPDSFRFETDGHCYVSRQPRSAAELEVVLRGSGDIHAAYDRGATLQRRQDGSIVLAFEHRSAPSPDPIAFRLLSRSGEGTSFAIVNDEPAEPGMSPATNGRVVGVVPRASFGPVSEAVDRQVLAVLERSGSPLSQVLIRRAHKVRNETLTATLRDIESRGTIENPGRMKGWRLRLEEGPEDSAVQASPRDGCQAEEE